MKQRFERKLDKYGFNVVIYFEPKLEKFPYALNKQITYFLSNNPDWKLVYWDDRFIKNVSLFKEHCPKCFTEKQISEDNAES